MTFWRFPTFCSALISKEALTQLVGTRNFKAYSIFGNFLRTPKITTPNVPLPINLTKSKFEQISGTCFRKPGNFNGVCVPT